MHGTVPFSVFVASSIICFGLGFLLFSILGAYGTREDRHPGWFLGGLTRLQLNESPFVLGIIVGAGVTIVYSVWQDPNYNMIYEMRNINKERFIDQCQKELHK